MNIRFYVDLVTGLPHVYNHNVDEAEVAEILASPGQDRAGSEGSRVALGQTSDGRYLRVIYVPDPVPNSVFVITAYEPGARAIAAYRRQLRRKR